MHPEFRMDHCAVEANHRIKNLCRIESDLEVPCIFGSDCSLLENVISKLRLVLFSSVRWQCIYESRPENSSNIKHSGVGSKTVIFYARTAIIFHKLLKKKKKMSKPWFNKLSVYCTNFRCIWLLD